MASHHFHKKKKVWYVSWRDEIGKQRTKSFGKGKKAEREAEAMANDINSAKLREEPLPEVCQPRQEGLYFDELAQEYLIHAKATGASERWLKEWTHTLNTYIVPILCENPVNELAYSDVLKVAQFYANRAVSQEHRKKPKPKKPGQEAQAQDPEKPKRMVSQSTINRYLGYLRSIFRHGVAKGLTSRNPLEGWKKPKEQPKNVSLTPEDLKKIMRVAAPHLAWGLEVAANLVLRVGESELSEVKWEKVDWDRGGVWVWQTKVKDWKFVPCRPKFMQKLASMKERSACEYLVEYRGRQCKSFRSAWYTALKRAEIPYDVDPYDVRHLVITEMLKKGEDAGAVSKLAGHANPYYTITRYHHVNEHAKAEAIKSLPDLSMDDETPAKVIPIRTKKKAKC